jgi:hypothetical protein
MGLGLELLILGIVPRNERFRRHVRSQKIAEQNQPPSQREIFQRLDDQSQRRYAKLRKLRQDIQANYRRLSYASQGILDGHLDKIDGLLESYLDLLHQRERYRDFMNRSTEAQLQKRIRALKADMSDDGNRVRAVKQRRLRVLKQRLARFRKAHENLEIIGAQLGTIEDVVKYIHEQSWTLQDPQEVGMQLDTLLEEVEETQASIREIEDVFTSPGDYLQDDLDELDAELEAEVEAAQGREGADALDLPREPQPDGDSTPRRERVRE